VELLVDHELGQKVEVLAAVFLREEGSRSQAEPVRLLDHLVRKFLGLVVIRRDRANLFFGELVSELSDRLLLRRW